MTSEDAVVPVIDELAAAGIPYMLVGSFSSNLYGVPRSTRAADFVIQTDSTTFGATLANLRSSFEVERQLAFEPITGTSKQVLITEGGAFKVELFFLSEDEHDQERFRRRKSVHVWNRDVLLPTAEDVIITKLRWSRQGKRQKDAEDVANVMMVQLDSLDFDYLRKWCRSHGTLELLEQIRAAIPRY